LVQVPTHNPARTLLPLMNGPYCDCQAVEPLLATQASNES
jgi:hypothetical protein